jgi:hypothetical protein
MISRVVVCVLSILVAISAMAQSPQNAAEIKRLATFLEGRFTSLPQSRDDTTITPIQLRIRRIWNDRTDGYWFLLRGFTYVKDSVLADIPSDISVIHIHEIEHGLIEQERWDVRNPDRLTSYDKDTTILEQLTVHGALVKRRGCEVVYQIGADFYLGRTAGTACAPPRHTGATATIATWTVRASWIEVMEQYINDIGEVVAGRKGKPIFFMRDDEAVTVEP